MKLTTRATLAGLPVTREIPPISLAVTDLSQPTPHPTPPSPALPVPQPL